MPAARRRASKSHGRAAARTAAAILAVLAGLLFSWSLGSTWARAEPTSGDEINPALLGLCLSYAGVLLVRVGYGREHMPSAVTRFADLNAWVIVIVPLGGALQRFAATYYVDGAINLIIALLAFVVVLSERPASPTSGAAPTPSGKLDRPTSAH